MFLFEVLNRTSVIDHYNISTIIQHIYKYIYVYIHIRDMIFVLSRDIWCVGLCIYTVIQYRYIQWHNARFLTVYISSDIINYCMTLIPRQTTQGAYLGGVWGDGVLHPPPHLAFFNYFIKKYIYIFTKEKIKKKQGELQLKKLLTCWNVFFLVCKFFRKKIFLRFEIEFQDLFNQRNFVNIFLEMP